MRHRQEVGGEQRGVSRGEPHESTGNCLAAEIAGCARGRQRFWASAEADEHPIRRTRHRAGQGVDLVILLDVAILLAVVRPLDIVLLL